jgi:hypothetical protein
MSREKTYLCHMIMTKQSAAFQLFLCTSNLKSHSSEAKGSDLRCSSKALSKPSGIKRAENIVD